uniref:Repressor of RNA polymerase III transcription n=1 Tax=Oryza punctata TaxID=4537 RepID=A0A0E0JZJ2_ORYPU
MKLLEYTPFDSINFFLDKLDLGNCTIRGSLDAFSFGCDHGTVCLWPYSLEVQFSAVFQMMGLYKFLFTNKSLLLILDSLSKSSDSNPSSPVEHLSSRSSRKALIYLVLTLSHLYPDYNFSGVQAHLFFKDEDWESFKQMVDTYLLEASREWTTTNQGSSLLDSMTGVIDEVIKINESDIYSYTPDLDGDPFVEKGAIWSINFFFYNQKLKRVVSFRCSCTSKLSGDDFLAAAPSDGEEEDALIDMDM